MKYLLKTALLLLVIFAIQNETKAQGGSWEFYEYANVKNDLGVLMKLEYGIREKGYDGRIRWRITNMTENELYDVTIGKQQYTFGRDFNMTKKARRITKKIKANDSKSTKQIDLNSIENTGQFQDKNNNPFYLITIEEPVIAFKLSKDGALMNWAEWGTVTMLETEIRKRTQRDLFEYE